MLSLRNKAYRLDADGVVILEFDQVVYPDSGPVTSQGILPVCSQPGINWASTRMELL